MYSPHQETVLIPSFQAHIPQSIQEAEAGEQGGGGEGSFCGLLGGGGQGQPFCETRCQGGWGG